jgi:hypothetical protein
MRIEMGKVADFTVYKEVMGFEVGGDPSKASYRVRALKAGIVNSCAVLLSAMITVTTFAADAFSGLIRLNEPLWTQAKYDGGLFRFSKSVTLIKYKGSFAPTARSIDCTKLHFELAKYYLHEMCSPTPQSCFQRAWSKLAGM